MKEFAPQLARISSAERLFTTLFFAVLLHGIVILGVTFSGEESSNGSSTLEITLVGTSNNTLPEDADYLANTNQRGSGNTLEQVRPQSAMSSPERAALDGVPDGNETQNRLEALNDSETPDVLETLERSTAVDRQVMTRSQSDIAAPTEANAPLARNERVLVARLMTPGNEFSEPVNDANQQALAHSDNLREKIVAVNTRESIYARYLDEWRRQVERVGNANFPDEARREGMHGSLELEVALNSNGTIRNLSVRHKSPHPLLDDAALRIVRLAAPFPPFSDEMNAETDVLRFRWVWKFNPNGSTSSVRASPDAQAR